MALVGVLSDTHGRLASEAYAALADCDAIIHAGDICSPGILAQLEALAPTYAVLGNNDFAEYGDAVARFARPVIDGVRFLVAHYPRDVQIGFNGCAGCSAGDPIPQVCVHGHTHVPRLEWGPAARPAQFVVCPGSVSLPRGGFPCSVAKLEVSEGRIAGVRIEALDGGVLLEWPEAQG
ncbi:YfcE family phosphodiesterase [Eggerthellaceae bacterium zg-887]|uniref:YfcE family phosphodiesterase n=1 Tax=Xiamenia xianingshaonis TaxID=2682776 RepID=UPI00140816E3|nr:YfcE family phosphodiesterase [Xiamenia xianingshaonis]NHM15535.1 YfcE family phosphodiesterase [Xiamenia xianingshaonis]